MFGNRSKNNHTPKRFLRVLITITLGAAGQTVRGQCESANLSALDAGNGDQFGSAVAVWGEVALVGAIFDDPNGGNSGSVYAFRKSIFGWQQWQKLTAPDGGAGHLFGISVDLHGDVAVIGARENTNKNGLHAGATYVFRFIDSEWIMEQKIIASDGQENGLFGAAVAIWKDTIIVGAPQDSPAGVFSGSAYVFRFSESEWVEEQKLVPTDGTEQAVFGWSVDIEEDTSVIGAKWDPDNGAFAGAVYVYESDGEEWVQRQKLLPLDGVADSDFGGSTTIRGDRILIGAARTDEGGTNSGSAYVFHETANHWTQEVKLVAADPAPFDFFGCCVTLSDDLAVIGSRADNPLGLQSGSAYVFRFNGLIWLQEQKLIASDELPCDQFGSAVSSDGNRVVIGAPRHGEPVEFAGTSYVFELTSNINDCNDNSIADECEIAAGLALDCNHNDVPDPCDIADGTLHDKDGSGIPDECEAGGDLDGNGSVGATDLVILLSSWGPCADCSVCPADLDDDCAVGASDLLILLVNWS